MEAPSSEPEDLTLGAMLFDGSDFTAYEGSSRKFGEGLVVKVYMRQGIIATECLLKEALRHAAPASGGMTLIDVCLMSHEKRGLDGQVSVNFVLRKNQSTISEDEMMKSYDSKQPHRGLEEYGTPERVQNQEKEIYTVPGRDVIIKSAGFLYISDANSFVREAFVQARVAHERNCRIIDICVSKEQPDRKAFKLHLVLEKMKRDMFQDIKQQIEQDREYTEQELFLFLRDVSEGLAYAKELVISKQNIAHCDIKPENIFVSNGRYKVGDFGASWTKVKSSLTLHKIGTVGYISPEIRAADPDTGKIDPFKSDIYSLGVTLLHLAALRFPTGSIAVAIQALGYSEQFKDLLAVMTETNVSLRPNLNEIMMRCEAMHEDLPQQFVCRNCLSLNQIKVRDQESGMAFCIACVAPILVHPHIR